MQHFAIKTEKAEIDDLNALIAKETANAEELNAKIEDLAASILNSPDVDTVREGIPAYIIMLDSFLRRSPEDTTLLLTAAELNGAFSTFTEGDRAKVLTSRALDFALRAACA